MVSGEPDHYHAIYLFIVTVLTKPGLTGGEKSENLPGSATYYTSLLNQDLEAVFIPRSAGKRDQLIWNYLC